MEVVAIEGILTDYEVKELIHSPLYEKLDSLNTAEAGKRRLLSRQHQLDKRFRPHENRLQTYQIQFQAGQLTDAQFQTNCSKELKNTQALTREIASIRTNLAYYNRTISTIWMREQMDKYVSQRPCCNQTELDIQLFMQNIQQFSVKYHVTITQTEIIMLANTRPEGETSLGLVLSGLFDRIPSADERAELLEIITKLPAAPPIEDFVEATDVVDEKAGDDEFEEGDIYAEDVYEVGADDADSMNDGAADFDNSYDQQHDQDDDEYNDDE